MLSIATVLLSGVFSAAPLLAPIVKTSPLWVRALLTAITAAAGSAYHVVQAGNSPAVAQQPPQP